MFFDTFVCVGIVAVIPMIVALFISFYNSKHTTISNGRKMPIAGEILFYIYLIMMPVVIAQTGILNHSYNWLWYVGCSLGGMLGFCTVPLLVFPKGRAMVRKEPLIFIPVTVLLTIAIICIRLA